MERVEVAVVGAGQSGLATSYWLADRGLDHVLLERDRSGDSWRDRWDSFCLVTPNWSLRLPGFPYDGDDPDGFIPRDAIADHVVSYQQFVDAPVQESTDVSGLHRSGDDLVLTTDKGDWMAQSVVVATGGYPFRSIPRLADSLDPDLLQVHSQDYRRPSALPSGAVLVVGSGQSGAQIVDDLMLEGREVWFAMGHTGRAPRRYRGRDVTAWLADMGFFEAPIQDPAMREQPSIIVSGRDGGKDLDPRAFGRDGVHLLGRILGANGMTARFNDDVDEMLDAADGMAAELEGLVDGYIEERGVNPPTNDVATVNWVPGSTRTDLDLETEGIGSVIWATGYHCDFSWIQADVFDAKGYPRQERGVTNEPGLYFVGLHGMHSAGSGLFYGVGADAEYIVEHIATTRS